MQVVFTLYSVNQNNIMKKLTSPHQHMVGLMHQLHKERVGADKSQYSRVKDMCTR